MDTVFCSDVNHFYFRFFIDYIEIIVVVLPIVAPILLADPSANITAIWLGVMVGVNMQTSFLTPPFGFALFYLRGVAPKSITTADIWKGATPFIFLQLGGLLITGLYPSLSNYIPFRSYLTSDLAPPSTNPKLEKCLMDYTYSLYRNDEAKIRKAIAEARTYKIDILPSDQRSLMNEHFTKSLLAMDQIKIAERKKLHSMSIVNLIPFFITRFEKFKFRLMILIKRLLIFKKIWKD